MIYTHQMVFNIGTGTVARVLTAQAGCDMFSYAQMHKHNHHRGMVTRKTVNRKGLESTHTREHKHRHTQTTATKMYFN